MNITTTKQPLKFVLVALASTFLLAVSVKAAPPVFAVKDQRLILENGYVYLEFDLVHPSLNVIKADYGGQGRYGVNLVGTNEYGAAGIVLETVDADGSLHASSSSAPVAYQVLENDAAGLRVRIRGLGDRESQPEAVADWTLFLPANSRKFTLTSRTTLSGSRALKSVEIGVHLNQWFMNGLFQRGVVQYVGGCDQSFYTSNALHTFYTMDNQNGSVAVVPHGSATPSGWAMISGGTGAGVGLEMILAGRYSTQEKWSQANWKFAPEIMPTTGTVVETRMDVYPNNYAFPVFSIPANDPMSFRSTRTIYTAIYGSAAGVLGSFKYDGSAYPTLATPKRTYGDMYTFFDPDAWSTVAALSFSGDSYLQDQARRIVELAAANIRDGQIPHHFIAGKPAYIAISKATQTGPNIFWTLAAIDYATGTGDESWLQEHYPQMKAATDWVLSFYDPKHKMVKVGGPLFIDVFIRQGYTLDSNAMLLRLLPLMASVARFCGDAATASRYDQLAESIKQGMNAGLWNGQDHYVTQLNPDGSTRDMVDYDGNYAAIAFGATTNSQRIAAMYHRLDGGPHTHPGNRGTWVSEKYYGPKDCRGGNTGDSATAMARIWWLDLDSRYVTGDQTNFYKYFEPVQNDLLQHTWMTERYNAQGQLIRAPYYHEYPEITAMILREMVYGIDVKIDHVRIQPFGINNYHYQVGGLDVDYRQDRVSLHVPGHSGRIYEIHGLIPLTDYSLSNGRKATTDSAGVLVFHAPAGRTITLRQAAASRP